jgi:NAD(P)-dependent dehydrogenase (short-subunit alcohol dehydrogenase family)
MDDQQRRQRLPMKTIVITGSTRGIGYGLAQAFLARGQAVVISGRTAEAVDEAVATLRARQPGAQVLGQPCQVSDLAQVEALWAAAKQHFGRVDIWINNAGISHPPRKLWELPRETIDAVVATNVTGSLYGTQVAARGMLAQGGGFIYDLHGFGSTGMVRPGLSVYGLTKYAVAYLTKALSAEAAGGPVKIGAISPGIVATELMTQPYDGDPAGLERAKRVFNILGDKVDTVTPWLADRVLANTQSGVVISWLTPAKAAWRFATASFNRNRNIFEA